MDILFADCCGFSQLNNIDRKGEFIPKTKNRSRCILRTPTRSTEGRAWHSRSQLLRVRCPRGDEPVEEMVGSEPRNSRINNKAAEVSLKATKIRNVTRSSMRHHSATPGKIKYCRITLQPSLDRKSSEEHKNPSIFSPSENSDFFYTPSVIDSSLTQKFRLEAGLVTALAKVQKRIRNHPKTQAFTVSDTPVGVSNCSNTEYSSVRSRIYESNFPIKRINI